MALSLIGAGFGRTGTDSMRAALNTLGVGPCYHMYEVLPHPDRVDMWRGIANGNTPDWDKTYEGYGAAVDWPTAYYWRELSAHFPDAKILLTIRDAESWYRSMDKTILEVLRSSTETDSIAGNLLARQVFDGKFNDKDHVIATYNKNTADVQAAFGADRLLTYIIGDGWAPLCEFLGCDIPDEPYPHTNKPGEFMAKADDGTDKTDATN